MKKIKLSKSAEKFTNENEISVIDSNMKITLDCNITKKTTFYKFDVGDVFDYPMYFSYATVADNCLCFQLDFPYFDDTLIEDIDSEYASYGTYSTYINDIIKGNRISKYKKLNVSMGTSKVARELITIKTPNLYLHTNDIVDGIRKYLNVPKVKIVLLLNFNKCLRTNTVYTDLNFKNDLSNYEVVTNCSENLYFDKNGNAAKLKPKDKLIDNKLGYLLGVCENSLATSNSKLEQDDKQRIIELLSSKEIHDLSVHIHENI